jgi:hypothetical protein
MVVYQLDVWLFSMFTCCCQDDHRFGEVAILKILHSGVTNLAECHADCLDCQRQEGRE